jgi:uncharacterized protein (UPF0276 family)
MEVGIEVSKGLDNDVKEWVSRGLPTTYHFLDVNLNEVEDLDSDWLERLCDIKDQIKPAWLCGDLGLWHLGRRERGHMLLLPPILTRASARDYATGIETLREVTGLEVLPENPPGQLYLGDMELLDYFATLCEEADTGMLLDCAHLAMYQRLKGLAPIAGLADFPLERVVELHIAGGTLQEHDGFQYIEDSHVPEVLDDTWAIVEFVLKHAENVKAVTYECERNTIEAVAPGFERIHRLLGDHAVGGKA